MNLQWSKGLARACRDLVLDLGPYGLTGHKTTKNKDESARANQYTSSVSGLREVIVYTDIEDPSKDQPEAWETYEQMMSSGSDRDHLFDPDMKYVGISCGCHATEGEMCCF